MNILSLFDGISCGQVAINELGIEYDNYYASEIDKFALAVTRKNYPNTIQLGDIRNVYGKDLPKIDLLMGGSPCQSFSDAGNKSGFEGKSGLFWDYVRLKNEINPTFFLLENVSMRPEWMDIITNEMGVEPITINSSLVSAQNRKRLYWTNIPNVTIPEDRNIHLKEIVGDYEGIWVYPRGFNKGGVQSYNGKSPTVTISSWQHNFMIYKDGKKRKFTPNEVEQLQNLPIDYTDCISDNQRYKAIGNGWTINVITHILKNIK